MGEDLLLKKMPKLLKPVFHILTHYTLKQRFSTTYIYATKLDSL